MTKKQKRFRLIDFFKRKSEEKLISINNKPSDGEMILSGKRQGDFYADDMITVTEDSHISGTIVTTNGIMKGKITGNITCTGELLIEPTAIIEGNITAKIIDIRPGSIIHGTFTHLSATDLSTTDLSTTDTVREQPDQVPTPLPEVPRPINNDVVRVDQPKQLPADKQPTSWW